MYYSIQVIKLNIPAYAASKDDGKRYQARYKRSINGRWQWYSEGVKRSWKDAYAILEKHANPAVLAVRFVGTF